MKTNRFIKINEDNSQLQDIIAQPSLILRIPNPSIELQIAAVKRNPSLIDAMANIDPKIISSCEDEIINYIKQNTKPWIHGGLKAIVKKSLRLYDSSAIKIALINSFPPYLMYFKSLSPTVLESCKHEIIKFLLTEIATRGEKTPKFNKFLSIVNNHANWPELAIINKSVDNMKKVDPETSEYDDDDRY